MNKLREDIFRQFRRHPAVTDRTDNFWSAQHYSANLDDFEHDQNVKRFVQRGVQMHRISRFHGLSWNAAYAFLERKHPDKFSAYKQGATNAGATRSHSAKESAEGSSRGLQIVNMAKATRSPVRGKYLMRSKSWDGPREQERKGYPIRRLGYEWREKLKQPG